MQSLVHSVLFYSPPPVGELVGLDLWVCCFHAVPPLILWRRLVLPCQITPRLPTRPLIRIRVLRLIQGMILVLTESSSHVFLPTSAPPTLNVGPLPFFPAKASSLESNASQTVAPPVADCSTQTGVSTPVPMYLGHDHALPPYLGSPDAAGYDLYASIGNIIGTCTGHVVSPSDSGLSSRNRVRALAGGGGWGRAGCRGTPPSVYFAYQCIFAD